MATSFDEGEVSIGIVDDRQFENPAVVYAHRDRTLASDL
jgi:hypothetical protein